MSESFLSLSDIIASRIYNFHTSKNSVYGMMTKDEKNFHRCIGLNKFEITPTKINKYMKIDKIRPKILKSCVFNKQIPLAPYELYNDIAASHKRWKTYMPRYNGARPFLVYVNHNKKLVDVYRRSSSYYYLSDDNEHTHDKYVTHVQSFQPIRIFIGEEDEIGNSILLHMNDEKNNETYVFIGGDIKQFSVVPGDKINKYVSYIGNSDVPYPYAISKKNIYLPLEDVYIPTLSKGEMDEIVRNDPYDYYYNDRSTGKPLSNMRMILSS